MTLLVVTMLVITGLGVAVVGVVAVPAHRLGRDLLTTKGEGVARSAQRRAHTLGRGTRARTP